MVRGVLPPLGPSTGVTELGGQPASWRSRHGSRATHLSMLSVPRRWLERCGVALLGRERLPRTPCAAPGRGVLTPSDGTQSEPVATGGHPYDEGVGRICSVTPRLVRA
jgi:hypothetical protein